MTTRLTSWRGWLLFGFGHMLFDFWAASLIAATFTNDTRIGVHDTRFDGQDIVVEACTLTVDGFHSFSSLQVLAGGVLTHSSSTNGLIENVLDIFLESHVLTTASPSALDQGNALASSVAVFDPSGATNYVLDVDYNLIATNNQVELVLIAGSRIADGATVSVSYQAIGLPVQAGMVVVVANNVEIEFGGAINVDGCGFGGGAGEGHGGSLEFSTPYVYPAGGGGGYGGSGGSSSGGATSATGGACYGSIVSPSDLGSGGGAGLGSGGAGGGEISLTVGGFLKLDGEISASGADGINPHSGAGSGGSIRLSLSALGLFGAGSIAANGGNGEPRDGGGGGGGRIAIFISGGQTGTNSFTGAISARGGAGATFGGAGTVYWSDELTGLTQILTDNGGHQGSSTLLSIEGAFDQLTISGGALVSAGTLPYLNNVLIGSNSWLSPLAPSQGAVGASLTMAIGGGLTIQSGGGITTDGLGPATGSGAGAGGSVYSSTNGIITGGGGGYGGFGGGSAAGAAGGRPYGDMAQSLTPGSGGGYGAERSPGGAGGGLIQLTIPGTLTLDGAITANGAPGSGPGSGGGSGGGISLGVGVLAGTGLISACGGPGELPLGGGGGGGRIAILYQTNLYGGSAWARGAAGSLGGGPGTVYSKPYSNSIAQLVVDNGGLPAPTNTPLTTPAIPWDLTISGGARVDPGSLETLDSLFIGSNSWLAFASSGTMPAVKQLGITGAVVIAAGGGIDMDGMGYPAARGPGAGASSFSQPGQIGAGGGGGYGGRGGSSAYLGQGIFELDLGVAIGGNDYGSANGAAAPGSGGGNGAENSLSLSGGAGGGALILAVGGALIVDGTISANGTAGLDQGSGGGSGGSITLAAATVSGAGVISANGGSGDLPYGGGGGGGRIFISKAPAGEALAWNFSGTLSAYGGPGANFGGAGTVLVYAGPPSYPWLSIDNGGAQGTNTPFTLTESSAQPIDLLVSRGGIAILPTLQGATLRDLFVGENSTLTFSNATVTPVAITITSNATIQAGGNLSIDGQGYPQGQGPGRGASSSNPTSAGGGGYGGFGGASAFGPGGGVAYGSVTSPLQPGSGGGIEFAEGVTIGGVGGGALAIAVDGTLVLDGRIGADGTAGSGGQGGGSGGGILLSAGLLSGTGLVSANGGAANSPGGGGGGGRIAVYFASNQFSGTFSARGGEGASFGGAGTVFVQPSNGAPAQVIVDNGGAAGTNTGLTILNGRELSLVVTGGAQASVGFIPTLASLLIASNSWIVYSNSVAPGLVVAGNAAVQAGGGIRADGAGYPAGQGPGAGHSYSSQTGGGGGYGGNGAAGGGGALGGMPYGSFLSPQEPGSGGAKGLGPGGSGGGKLLVTVDGSLLLDGIISSEGADALGQGGGGGSGGAVAITAGSISGSGAILADGGAGDPEFGGGGSGGRIALYSPMNLFTGSFSAHGGPGLNNGAAGTIFVSGQGPNAQPSLTVDNGGFSGAVTPLTLSTALDLTVSGGAVANPSNGILLSLVISSNASLVQLPSSPPQALKLTVLGDTYIQAGGKIKLDGAGFSAALGAGAGASYSNTQVSILGSGGGGYGGDGADSPAGVAGGISYGSAVEPVDLGSSAGGGLLNPLLAASGGGGLQLTIQGDLVLDGSISADGGGAIQEGGGGGSGGSIWLTTRTLAGSGEISAKGGAADPAYGGGGGGGRIAVYFSTNEFTGTFSAQGGGGAMTGGAGTIYSRTNGNAVGSLRIDNAGQDGAATPIDGIEAFFLTVSGGAVAAPSSDTFTLTLSTLRVDSGAGLRQLDTQTNLDLTVLGDALVASNSWISADGAGYHGADGGPGAGLMTNALSGSGGGYGNTGGASLTGIPGGPAYGSLQQPIDRGSRGGVPLDQDGYSQGGGAIRLRVGGVFTLDGGLSANGNDALIEGAGGGAGGSIWLTAREIHGSGSILAQGGAGEPAQGGGGAGGRIALYCRTNNYGGTLSAPGGAGPFPGGDGSLFLTTTLPALQVLTQSPAGQVSFAVSNVDLAFGSVLDLNSLAAASAELETPNGILAQGSVTLTALDLSTLRLSFPPQTTQGYYEIRLGQQVKDIYGDSMPAAFAGSFVILAPLISGRITDANGQAVPFVTLNPAAGLLSIVTDASGFYSIEVPPGWSGTVTPAKGDEVFIPTVRVYSNVSSGQINQDFVAVSPSANTLALVFQGLAGSSYQLGWSTNLVDWLPYSPAFVCTNNPINVSVPIGPDPAFFFRLRPAPTGP